VYSDSDVFVIGGGPAGLAAAIAATRKGFSATVADGAEPPIDKPCGEGMMPETQAALKGLGIELPSGVGWTFRGIRFVQQDSQITADFPMGRGIGIRRPVLHGVLIEAARKCGVRFRWKSSVVGIETRGVRLADGFANARWIIGADGAASRVRRWAELNDTVRRRQRVANRRHYRIRPWSEFMEIHWGHRSQAYVTPISAEEICVVMMGDTPESIRFESALPHLPRLRECLAGGELHGRERGAVTVMHQLRRVSRGNVALIGDASGGVDAITGDGLRLAFRQAAALADAMKAGDLRAYNRPHRELQKRPLWMGKLLVEFGRQDAVRAKLMRLLTESPKLFSGLLAIHVGRATSLEAATAGAQLGWRFIAA